MRNSNSFWCLQIPKHENLIEWDDNMDLKQVICPITSDHQGAGARIGNLRVILPSPQFTDFMVTWYSDILIQDSVLQRFREAGFTGFEVKPVEVTRVRRLRTRTLNNHTEEQPRLWELLATGWAGEAPLESGIRMKYYCEGCGVTEYTNCTKPQYLINASQWDKSDFFIVWPLPKYIFITNRVAEVIQQEHYTGICFVKPKDLDIRTGMGFSPGPPPPGRSIRGPEAFPKVRIRRYRQKK